MRRTTNVDRLTGSSSHPLCVAVRFPTGRRSFSHSGGNMGNLAETYRERLPAHGYAADDYSRGVRVYAVAEAIKKAIVQHNWRNSLSWLVYDVDRGTAAYDYQDRAAPPPNIVAINTNNGHAHLFYGLEEPVHKNTTSSQKAQRYAASIDVALTRALGADPGYSKLLSKNPLHDRWVTLYVRADLYDLDELAGWLDLEPYKDKRRRLPAIGEGRNVTLFESLRLWAYRARRQPYLSEEMFLEAVRSHAMVLNADFHPPLPHSEVRSTAKSVARWTWRKMSTEGFRAYQKRRSQLAAQKRTSKAQELRAAIVEAHEQCPGLAQADLAAMFGVTQPTVSNHLRNYKSPISDSSLPAGASGPSSAGSKHFPPANGHYPPGSLSGGGS